VLTVVSEEHIASIFRVEIISWAKNQHGGRWQGGKDVRGNNRLDRKNKLNEEHQFMYLSFT
jgi:hypothetical protein